jgi:hypothetical protein
VPFVFLLQTEDRSARYRGIIYLAGGVVEIKVENHRVISAKVG